MRARLNLASRPFRNEALPNLGFLLALLLGVGATAQHALHLRRLLGETSSTLHTQVVALEQELQQLRSEARSGRVAAPLPATLAEWRVVKALVDRRSFSWSQLLSRLEEALPAGVRLTSIAPLNPAADRVPLEVAAVARSRDEGFEFARVLLQQGSFRDVYPESVRSTPRGEEFVYQLSYRSPEQRP